LHFLEGFFVVILPPLLKVLSLIEALPNKPDGLFGVEVDCFFAIII